MLKENELIGAIAIYRQERPFTDKQIELVQQLRRAGRHRHREHASTTERTAREHRSGRPRPPTCVRSISRSTFDLQPVPRSSDGERDEDALRGRAGVHLQVGQR